MRRSGLFVVTCIILIFSCKKTADVAAGTTASFSYGGISNFDYSEIDFSADTATLLFTVTLSAESTKAFNVSVGVDDLARVAYNTTSSLSYAALPDSCYNIPLKTVQIAQSNFSAVFSITFYKQKINPNISYMLPVVITDASGVPIIDSLKTLYFHLSVNGSSGFYTNAGTKTLYSGSSAIADSINSIISCPVEKEFVATAPNTSTLDYADLGSSGWQYIVTVDSLTKVVNIQPNSIILYTNSILPQSFVVDTATYNSVNQTFHFKTEYKNINGQLRIVDETLTRQ